MPGRPRGSARLARALGLDGNPLRRAGDRAEAWIRIGLIAVFLVAGPMAARGAGGWAYHAGITSARVQPASAHHVNPAAFPPVLTPSYLDRAGQGSPARAQARAQGPAASARSGEVLAVIMTLAFTLLALLALLRLTRALLTRRHLAAWETAWSTVGPQWSGGRP